MSINSTLGSRFTLIAVPRVVRLGHTQIDSAPQTNSVARWAPSFAIIQIAGMMRWPSAVVVLQMKMPNEALLDIMRQAYTCSHLSVCKQADISPRKGLIPRGFVGATGKLSDVEAVFVLAEPGHPLAGETYTEGASPDQLMKEAITHTYSCFKSSAEPFHRNMRWVLNEAWPGAFDDQMEKVWITEGRLCSIYKEIGGFNDKLCAPTYLSRQLQLMPNATVVLFGRKALRRASLIPDLGSRAVVEAWAIAPPGAFHKPAKPSWERAIEVIRARARCKGATGESGNVKPL